MEDPEKLIDVSLLCHIGESLAIIACTLGKTSFAITLMRIFFQKWMRAVLWFIIITMNIVNVLAALFVFLQCKDPRNLWDKSIPSECWPIHVFTHFSLFVGGKAISFFSAPVRGKALNSFAHICFPISLLRCPGFRSGSAPMDRYLGPADEKEGKGWHCHRHEHGYLVS